MKLTLLFTEISSLGVVNILDNDDTTYFHSANSVGTDEWLQVDFLEEISVLKILTIGTNHNLEFWALITVPQLRNSLLKT